MPSQRIIQLCTGSDTVTSTLAGNPEHDVASIAKRLFKTRSVDGKEHEETPVSRDSDPMGDVLKCGKFPYRPSDLFLKVRGLDYESGALLNGSCRSIQMYWRLWNTTPWRILYPHHLSDHQE